MFFRDETEKYCVSYSGKKIASKSLLENCAAALREALGIADGQKGRGIPDECICRITRICDVGWKYETGVSDPLVTVKSGEVCSVKDTKSGKKFSVSSQEFYTFRGLIESSSVGQTERRWETAILWPELYLVCGRVFWSRKDDWDTVKVEEELNRASLYFCKKVNGGYYCTMDYPNKFKDTLYEYICQKGDSGNGRVSVRAVLEDVAARDGKTVDEYLNNCAFAEDAIYVWIRVLGYEADITETETTAQTAARMKGYGVKNTSDEDFACDILKAYGGILAYLNEVAEFIKNGENAEGYQWSDRDKIGVKLDPFCKDIFEKNIKKTQKPQVMLYLLTNSELMNSAAYSNVRTKLQSMARDTVKSQYNDMLLLAFKTAEEAVLKANDRTTVSDAAKAIEDIEAIVKSAKEFIEEVKETNHDLEDEAFERVIYCEVVQKIGELRESLKRQEKILADKSDQKRVRKAWERLQDSIKSIIDGLKACEIKLRDAASKVDVIELQNWLDKQEKALRQQYSKAASANYASVRDDGGIDGAFINSTVAKYRELISAKLNDPSLPELKDTSEDVPQSDESGAKIQFIMVDDHMSAGKQYAGSSYSSVYDYGAYRDMVNEAIKVESQPVFSDYPDVDSYPFMKPFRFQLDSVRAMLSRMGGRGVFGDQVGLGKTLQTVMAADMMFRCGAIVNAVIVVREANVYQWRNEIESKFRNVNGKCMFKLYPEGGKKNFYTVDELREISKDSEFSTRDERLKIYFLSSNSLQSHGFVEGVNELSSERAELTRIQRKADGLGDATKEIVGFNRADDGAVLLKRGESIIGGVECISELKLLKMELYLCLKQDVFGSRDEDFVNGQFRGKNYRLAEFKIDDSEFVELEGEGLFPLTQTYYNPMLTLIDDRIRVLCARRTELQADMTRFDFGAIGLLIFDEVQEIIDKLNSAGDAVRDAEVLREFVANANKKYCILISATPIKNDLSDIFELLYMVDKNRLGRNRAEAEDKFYRIYCGGHRTLSDMASSPDRDEKFKILNGLINSLFTRKRLYDPDVVESMRRHSATADERKWAEERGLDDYGGERFLTLMKALSVAYRYDKTPETDHARRTELLNALAEYTAAVYGGVGMSSSVFTHAALEMVKTVDRAVIASFYRNNAKYDDKFDIFDAFIKHKTSLIEAVEQNDASAISRYKDFCDRQISCINRGLIAFYTQYHEYSVKFLFDYLDWTRPPKKGIIPEVELKNAADKIDFFARVLDDENSVGADEVERELKFGKTVFYDKSPKTVKAIYRKLRECGAKRRQYLNLTDADFANGEFTAEDTVYLGYYGENGSSDKAWDLVSRINLKPAEERTSAEKRYVEGFNNESEKGISHSDRNFRRFSEFTSTDGNINAICFIDGAQTVGTDFNSANVLCIGQLDKGNNEYLDPIDFEQLIGRVSRLGQTSTCLIYTCLYNGGDGGAELDIEFNRAYYELLSDPAGFDILGSGSTEISFAQPVITACLRRLFSKKDQENDKGDFTAEFAEGVEPMSSSVRGFAEIFRYAYQNAADVTVTVRTARGEEKVDAVEGMKRLIRKYVSIISTPLTTK